ncbi:hypothetical protein [Flavobacterium sp.]|uniref:hypothetical protein n=1 Tax=Flavobacterium sp. TaxID=239 RepID=UPI003D2E0666
MKYILHFLLIITFISCKQEKNTRKNETGNKSHHTTYNTKSMNWDLHFPDTIILNQKYNGRIVYEGILDTITTSFEDEYSRYIKVIFITSDKINVNFETLEKVKKDTFGAINHKEIPFYDISFKKLGINYLHGYIIDHAFLEAKGTNPKDSLVRMIENEVIFSYKVFVKTQ